MHEITNYSDTQISVCTCAYNRCMFGHSHADRTTTYALDLLSALLANNRLGGQSLLSIFEVHIMLIRACTFRLRAEKQVAF